MNDIGKIHDMIVQFLETTKKPVAFLVVGALGCFAGGLVAELFLYLTEKQPPPQAICLTLDVSGSMAGRKLEEVKEASKKFIGQRNLSRDRIALTVFSSAGKVLVPFSRDKNELFRNIDSLLAYGGTNFEDAMACSREAIDKDRTTTGQVILLFTDGASSAGDPAKAVQTAQELQKRGIRLFAVATEDADQSYLAGLTGSRDRVIGTRDNRFKEAFAEAEKKISASQLMQSDGGYHTYIEAFIRSGGWTVFLALGIALALLPLQNHYLRKRLLPADQAIVVIVGSIAAGVVAGLTGQLAHTVFDLIHCGVLGRVLAWTVLGALLARGMVYFIPNLDAGKALMFGAIGGFLAVLGFLMSIGIMGDVGGRLLGALILGAFIGLLIALVELFYRSAWLMVLYDPRDFTQVNLGRGLVTIGSDKSDTIFIAEAAPRAGEFRIDGNKVRYTDSRGTQTMSPGSRIHIGTVELVVCSKETPFSPSKFYPMKMKKALEMQRKERQS